MDQFPAPVLDQPPEIPRAPGYLPEVLFGLFLIDAALILIGYRFPRAETSGILVSTLSAEIVILFAAMIRARRDPRRIIYVLMFATIFCIAWDATGIARGIMNWVGSIVEAGQRGSAVPPAFPTRLLFQRNQAFFGGGWRIAAGAIGLLAARLERK